MVDTVTAVDTPERVAFRFHVAGPATRGMAWLVDVLLQAGVVFALTMFAILLGLGLGETAMSLGAGVVLLGLFVISWFYGALFEWWWSGLTPGKWLLGVRVVRGDGAPLGWADAVLRNLMRGVDGLPFGYGIGALVCLADVRFRRLGDLVAGTMVIFEDTADLLADVVVDPPVSEAERHELPAALGLDPEELQVVERLLRRLTLLSDERAEELAEVFGRVVEQRTGWRAATWLRTVTLAYARTTGQDR